eukprot:SAG22_NODE_802_length_7099_cov_122.579429_1_plen_310_part_00
MPVGEATWQYFIGNGGDECVDCQLTVTELRSVVQMANAQDTVAVATAAGAAAAFAQADRCTGLVAIDPSRDPTLDGQVFTRDDLSPDANGRPHWSTAAGWHLYYFPDYRQWFLSYELFSPEEGVRDIYVWTPGEVPVGRTIWQAYCDEKQAWHDYSLTIIELSSKQQRAEAEVVAKAVEAARVAAAFAQADRCLGLRVTGLSQAITGGSRGMLREGQVFTRDDLSPDANGRPHWSTWPGGHLYYFPEYNMWFLSEEFSPEEDLRNASILVTESGEVPVGEATWQRIDGNGTWVACQLTITEVVVQENQS